MLKLTDIEQFLSEHGNFCLLDWLIEQNTLPYASYEAWRYGQLEELTSSLPCDSDELQTGFKALEKFCEKLKLQAEPQDYFSWGEQQSKKLFADKDKNIHTLLSQHWLRPQDIPQLDLFMDNSAVITENSLRAAIAGRQFESAQQKLDQLTNLNPKHGRLGGYQDLINYGLHIQDQMIIDAEYVSAELQGLQQEVVPLAKEILGNASRDFLAYAWRRIANNLEGINFDANEPEIHESFALAQIPDWKKLSDKLLASKELYPNAVLMARLCESLEKQHESAKATIIWALMVEQHAAFAEKTIESKQSKMIYNLWEDFWDINEDGPSEFFPAYLLSRQPGLVHLLNEFPPLVHTATSAMIELIKARINGDSEIAAREKLKSINPVLLQMYMNKGTN